MKQIFYPLLFVMAILCACTEDKGTYDYHTLNDIKIDTLEAQVITVFDTLRLQASVNQSQHDDDGNIDYSWYYYPDASSTEAVVVGNKSLLEYKIVLQPGDYRFYVTATDRTTGLWAKRSVPVKVTGQFSGGLLLLGKTIDGGLTLSHLSFSTSNMGKITEIYSGEEARLIGVNPVRLSESEREILVLCDDEEGGSALLKGTMMRSRSFKDMFMWQPEAMHSQFHTKVYSPFASQMGSTELAIVDGNAHFRKPKGDLFSPPLSGIHDFAPFVYMMRSNIIVYDNHERRFMRRDFGIFGDAIKLDPFPEPETGLDVFDPNNIGLRAVCLQMGRSHNESSSPAWCGIFKDDAGVMYALYLDVNYTAIDGLLALPMYKETVDESRLPGFTSATAFSSFDQNASIMYYATGDKLYMYSFDTKFPATCVLNLADYGLQGCKVSCMTCSTTMMGDQALHSGTDYFMAVNDENASAQGVVNSASILHFTLEDDGSGRIKEVKDVWRNVSPDIVSMLLQ